MLISRMTVSATLGHHDHGRSPRVASFRSRARRSACWRKTWRPPVKDFHTGWIGWMGWLVNGWMGIFIHYTYMYHLYLSYDVSTYGCLYIYIYIYMAYWITNKYIPICHMYPYLQSMTNVSIYLYNSIYIIYIILYYRSRRMCFAPTP